MAPGLAARMPGHPCGPSGFQAAVNVFPKQPCLRCGLAALHLAPSLGGSYQAPISRLKLHLDQKALQVVVTLTLLGLSAHLVRLSLLSDCLMAHALVGESL